MEFKCSVLKERSLILNPNKLTAEKALTLITIASIFVDISFRIYDKVKEMRKKEVKEVKKEYEGV